MRHGGDTQTFKNIYGHDFIDFSSNINPLGIPEEVISELEDSIPLLNKYPDIQYRDLKKELAKYLNCSKENVLVGNGVMELIDTVISMYHKILLVHPSFVEYEERAKVHDLLVDHIILKDNFQLNSGKDILERIEENQLVLLGNPNNPTGYRIDRFLLINIYKKVKEKKGLLVLDEAFFEFGTNEYDSIDLFSNDLSHLIILRAATKFFALPGIRLGYGVTNLELKNKIEERLLPWSVNTLAMKAGMILPKLGEYRARSQEYFLNERKRLYSALNEIKELEYYFSEANYILMRLKNKKASECLDFMAKNGILIRTCENFRGLDDRFIRVAIRNKEENDQLLEKLKEFLKG